MALGNCPISVIFFSPALWSFNYDNWVFFVIIIIMGKGRNGLDIFGGFLMAWKMLGGVSGFDDISLKYYVIYSKVPCTV